MERRTPSGKQTGFTYVAVLIGVAIMGAGLAAVGTVWHTLVQRENEKALLFVGNQFRSALNHYFLANQRYPMRLEDLVQDDSKLPVKRYLRKIYFDPMTSRTDWGFVTLPNGQIVGVFSLSDKETLKKTGFRTRDASFADKKTYSDWVFIAEGQSPTPGPVPGSPNSPGSPTPFSLSPLQPLPPTAPRRLQR